MVNARRLSWVVLVAALLAPVAARADAVPDELASAVRAIASASSFRMTTVQGKGKSVVELQRPDRTRLLLDGWEIVRIGDMVWRKQAGGEWKVASTSGAGKIPTLTNITLPANPVVRRLADESDGTGPAHVYAVSGDNVPELRWYVRAGDGRVHKIDVPPSKDGVPMTITIDEYGTPFTIEPPM